VRDETEFAPTGEPMHYADLQNYVLPLREEHIANLLNSYRAHTAVGGLFVNGLVFVDFSKPIQIPFQNIGLLYHDNHKRNKRNEKSRKKDCKSR